MSISVDPSRLNTQETRDLLKLLTFELKDKEEEERMKYMKKKFEVKCKGHIQMFGFDKEQGKLRIPYFFAIKYFKEPNTKVYNASFDKTLHPFILKLLDRQKEPFMEALRLLTLHNTVTIGLPPGFGKTIGGIWLAYIKGLCTLIHAHRDTIIQQWLTTISICCPSLLPYVWIVGENTVDNPVFILCMNTRYHHIPKDLMDRVGTVIVDEAHLFCTKGNKDCLLASNPKYIIMETATLERDDGMELMVQSIAGSHGVFKISTNPYALYKIVTGVHAEEKQGARGVNAGNLYKELSESEYRNLIILNIVKSNPDKKFIVLSKLAMHVELLENLLTANGIECDTLYGSKSKYSDSQVLLGTGQKMGTGFDESNACKNFKGVKSSVLILAHSVKKWQIFEQFRGRVMRADVPIVVWLEDKNKMVKRHFRNLIPWFKDTNAQIIDVEYEVDVPICLDQGTYI